MAKRQTRRSISIRGTTYVAVRNYCEQRNISMSEFVEERISQFFGSAPQRVAPAVTTPITPKRTTNGVKRAAEMTPRQLYEASRTFTF